MRACLELLLAQSKCACLPSTLRNETAPCLADYFGRYTILPCLTVSLICSSRQFLRDNQCTASLASILSVLPCRKAPPVSSRWCCRLLRNLELPAGTFIYISGTGTA